MLFRGQNMLGYRHYADDAVEYFVQKSVDNGIDIIRIFDCLNDLFGILGIQADWHGIYIGKFFKQHTFAFHDRHCRVGSNISKTATVLDLIV